MLRTRHSSRAPHRPLGLLRILPLPLLALSAPVLMPRDASAQITVTGSIQGVVTNKESGKPLAGVTVVVSGPALQSEQTEFTDASGPTASPSCRSATTTSSATTSTTSPSSAPASASRRTGT